METSTDHVAPSKFQRIVTIHRIMTPEEAFQVAVRMGCDLRTTEHIVREFRLSHDPSVHNRKCACGSLPNECEKVTRLEGRLGYDGLHDQALTGLGSVMGLSDDDLEALPAHPDKFPHVMSVWKAFFSE